MKEIKMHNQNEDKSVVWEMVKMDFRSATIKYSKGKKQTKEKYEKSLQEDLKLVQQQNTLVTMKNYIIYMNE
jgi:hypothetical protein